MDTDNNFDSDTSESWSLIDVTCERSTDVHLMDEIGAEALEARLEEVESDEKCSALPGDQAENGSPTNIIPGNNGNIASGNGHLKNQPHYQVLYGGSMFEDESDSELYAPGGYGRSYLDYGGNMDPETKDVDDDTDGISVISESELNEGKLNADESDDIWDEKPSDSDANENQSPDNLKKGKTPKVSSGESSDDNVNSGIAPEESCCSNGTDAEKNENEKQKKQLVIPPVYRPNRNNRPGLGLRLTLAIILSGISYVILGYLCGKEDSLRTANNMAETVKKLQKENLILHSRLTQLNRAVLARGVSKLDLKEETEPPCLKDELDCRKINLKLYEHNVDEGNYDFSHPRNKNSLDFSIPLNHPKNVLAFKQILVGNEVVLARKTNENFEPFNFSKYMEAIVSGHYTVGTPSAPLGIDGKPTKPMELVNENSSEPKDEEPGQKHGEPEGINCETDGSTPQDSTPQDSTPHDPTPQDSIPQDSASQDSTPHDSIPQDSTSQDSTPHDSIPQDSIPQDSASQDSTPQDGETRKDNCLAIQEKDLSQFRWFILKDKPKCTGIEVEDLEELESDCLYRIPMEKIYRKTNTDAFEDSDTAAAETDFSEGKDGEFIPSKTASAVQVDSKSTHDGDNLQEKKPSEKDSQSKKMKKRDMNRTPGGRNLDNSPSSSKKKRKDDKSHIDKYLNYFENIEKETKGNKRRMKECVMGKDGKYEMKFKVPDENNQAQNENYKKSGGKRSKPDGERKNIKKDQPPKGKKDKKKWKTCSIKADLKCGNDTKCDDCSCISGDWFSKYTEGREKCRRDQKISEWQFDRAKSREYSRMGDAFWQFSRANGRQSRRMSPYFRKKAKHFHGKGPGPKPDSQI